MPEFSKICDQINSVSSKLEKVKILSEYLQNLSDTDLHFACVYFTGSAFSARDTRKLNLGSQMIKKAIAQTVNMLDEDQFKIINEIYLKFSEPGEFAEHVLEEYRKGKKSIPDLVKDLILNQKNSYISLESASVIFDQINKINGSIAKVNFLADIFSFMNMKSSKYFTKILAGDLRIGLKEASVEEAIAKAFGQKSVDVKDANMFIGDIGEVALRAKNHNLAGVVITPFWPVKVMLATPGENSADILKRMGDDLWVEDKYDGIRCQVHKFNNEIKLFSRDQNEITAQFPEIVNYMKNVKGNFILDGEIMAFKKNEIMRFFFLQQRLGRKNLSEEILSQIPVEYFSYDILFLNGEQLFSKKLHERRQILVKFLGSKKTKYNNTNYDGIHFSHMQEIHGADELEKAFDDAKLRQTEGLMVKKPDSLYLPGKRGIEWIKYKKALEPLDVIITGVEYGHGKRRNQLSDYTFAVRDTTTGELVNIGKAYSGITDEQIKMLTEKFLIDTIEVNGRFRTVKPEVVLEINFESIQRSERNKSGYALRFPRITKLRIGDKGINDISTLVNVADLYEKHFAVADA